MVIVYFLAYILAGALVVEMINLSGGKFNTPKNEFFVFLGWPIFILINLMAGIAFIVVNLLDWIFVSLSNIINRRSKCQKQKRL